MNNNESIAQHQKRQTINQTNFVSATKTPRIISYVIDISLYSLAIFAIAMIFSQLLHSKDWLDSPWGQFALLVAPFALMTWDEFTHQGKTYGKSKMGLIVIRQNGSHPTLFSCILRQPVLTAVVVCNAIILLSFAFKGITALHDLLLLLAGILFPAIIFIDLLFAFRKNGLTLHDIFSGSIVIKNSDLEAISSERNQIQEETKAIYSAQVDHSLNDKQDRQEQSRKVINDAVNMIERGEFNVAADQLIDHLKLDQSSVEVWVLLIDLYQLMQLRPQFDRALDIFKKAFPLSHKSKREWNGELSLGDIPQSLVSIMRLHGKVIKREIVIEMQKKKGLFNGSPEIAPETSMSAMTTALSNTPTEEEVNEFYTKVAREIRDKIFDDGLLARANVEANGDDGLKMRIYMKLRFDQCIRARSK